MCFSPGVLSRSCVNEAFVSELLPVLPQRVLRSLKLRNRLDRFRARGKCGMSGFLLASCLLPRKRCLSQCSLERRDFIVSCIGMGRGIGMALGEGSLLAATAPAPKEWTPFQNSCDLCAPSFSVPSWRFLGRGGSGVVYAATCEGGDQPFVVKISSAQSWRQVALEFDVIQRLSSAKVPNIETPIRLLDASPSGSKVVAAVYYPEANGNLTGSLFDTMDPSIKARAAKAIGETVGAMLCEGIVCVDLQFLLDTDSGRLLVIDLTESLVLSHQPTAIDLSFVQSFLLESRSLIPDSLFPAAQQAAQMEFSRRFPKASRNYLESPEMSDVLLSSEWEFETR